MGEATFFGSFCLRRQKVVITSCVPTLNYRWLSSEVKGLSLGSCKKVVLVFAAYL